MALSEQDKQELLAGIAELKRRLDQAMCGERELTETEEHLVDRLIDWHQTQQKTPTVACG